MSIAFSSTVQYKLTGFYGLLSQPRLNLPGIDSDDARLRLILPVFKQCTNSCPANLMLARRIMRDHADTIRLVLMPINPEIDGSDWYDQLGSQLKGDVDILDTDFPLSRDLFAKYERLQSAADQPPQHAGFLYLYQPSSASLLTYTSPTPATIVSDIAKLNHGANDGDTHIQLVSN
jgi:cytochrome oxidase Cu insertion factor (SCO1/SenC/PrrC family)